MFVHHASLEFSGIASTLSQPAIACRIPKEHDCIRIGSKKRGAAFLCSTLHGARPAASLRGLRGIGGMFRMRPGRRALRFSKVPKPLRAQCLISAGLGGSVLAAVVYSKSAGSEDEAVWASQRGPLAWDAQRALELAPLIPCIGSGLVAVCITKMWLGTEHVNIPKWNKRLLPSLLVRQQLQQGWSIVCLSSRQDSCE